LGTLTTPLTLFPLSGHKTRGSLSLDPLLHHTVVNRPRSIHPPVVGLDTGSEEDAGRQEYERRADKTRKELLVGHDQTSAVLSFTRDAATRVVFCATLTERAPLIEIPLIVRTHVLELGVNRFIDIDPR
jgi:hypothetical protein